MGYWDSFWLCIFRIFHYNSINVFYEEIYTYNHSGTFFIQNIYYISIAGCTMVRFLDLNSHAADAACSNVEFVFMYFGQNEAGLTN